MTRHKRHSYTNGGRRYTTTESSDGRVTNSSSFKSNNTRVTQTNDNRGHSYTTITTRYGDGTYESKRLGTQPKTPRKHVEPIYEYSWQREDSQRSKRGASQIDPSPPTRLTTREYLAFVLIVLVLGVFNMFF